jgi:hypothetical protein
LTANAIDDPALAALAAGLQFNHTLESLQLFDIEASMTGFNACVRMLTAHNLTLVDLTLSGPNANWLSDVWMRRTLALARNSSSRWRVAATTFLAAAERKCVFVGVFKNWVECCFCFFCADA